MKKKGNPANLELAYIDHELPAIVVALAIQFILYSLVSSLTFHVMIVFVLNALETYRDILVTLKKFAVYLFLCKFSDIV